jgi:hypothetical protein
MPNNPCTATLRRLSGTTDVNIRSQPRIGNNLIFKVSSGISGLRVLDARPDADEAQDEQGRIHQWLQIDFGAGRIGWVRAEMVDIEGNCESYGYGHITAPTPAHNLTRSRMGGTGRLGTQTVAAVSTAAPTRMPQTAPLIDPHEAERMRRAAFALSTALSGKPLIGAYAYYHTTTSDNGDAHIIYGRFDFALASGALWAVLESYLNTSESRPSSVIRRDYAERVRRQDGQLAYDEHFQQALLDAARETEMQAAQNEIASATLWRDAVDKVLRPRGLRSPLAHAMIFDMIAEEGLPNVLQHQLNAVDAKLGLPIGWRVGGTDGVTEQQFVTEVATRRHEHATSGKAKAVRAEFWLHTIQHNDWSLRGDDDGMMWAGGHAVNVRTPGE